MFHKLITKRYSFSLLLLLITLLMPSCQTEPLDFQLSQTESTKAQEMITMAIDNCGGMLTKSYTYRYPYIGGTVGVENLRPNGGEPFRSVRKQIWRMYGNQAENLRVKIPAGTKREFTFVVTTITYRGIVSGEIIEANKNRPGQDATYFYPFTQGIEIDSYRDLPCSL